MCRNCTGISIGSSRPIHLLLRNPSAHAIEAYRDSGEARCAKSPHAVPRPRTCMLPRQTRHECGVRVRTIAINARGPEPRHALACASRYRRAVSVTKPLYLFTLHVLRLCMLTRACALRRYFMAMCVTRPLRPGGWACPGRGGSLGRLGRGLATSLPKTSGTSHTSYDRVVSCYYSCHVIGVRNYCNRNYT